MVVKKVTIFFSEDFSARKSYNMLRFLRILLLKRKKHCIKCVITGMYRIDSEMLEIVHIQLMYIFDNDASRYISATPYFWNQPEYLSEICTWFVCFHKVLQKELFLYMTFLHIKERKGKERNSKIIFFRTRTRVLQYILWILLLKMKQHRITCVTRKVPKTLRDAMAEIMDTCIF